jgi:FkbM family methyltransferase
MNRATPGELVTAFERGALPREAFWKAMAECHRRLLEHSCLLRPDGDIERIEITRNGLAVVFESGNQMAWNPDHLRSVPSVAVNHGVYEAHERRLAESLTAEAHSRAGEGGAVIFDVGANAGYYALHLARSLARRGLVFAFEPVLATFDQLAKNIQANAFTDHIEAVPLALGAEPGEYVFHVPAVHGDVAASGRPLFPEGQNERVTVRMETLDGFVERWGISRLDFIKCDVEGGERDFIHGGLKTLSEFRPWLMLELLRKWSAAFGYHPNEVLETLFGMGYRCWSFTDGQIAEHREITESCTQTNFFFLPASEGDAPLRRAVASLPKHLR